MKNIKKWLGISGVLLLIANVIAFVTDNMTLVPFILNVIVALYLSSFLLRK